MSEEQRFLAKLRLRLRGPSAFWGGLALFARVELDKSIEGIEADGQIIRLNPEQVTKRPIEETAVAAARVLIHQVLWAFHPEMATARGIEWAILRFLASCSHFIYPADPPHCQIDIQPSAELTSYWRQALAIALYEHRQRRVGPVIQHQPDVLSLIEPGLKQLGIDPDKITDEDRHFTPEQEKQIPDFRAIFQGTGRELRFPEDPLIRYATTMVLSKLQKTTEEATQALLWMVDNASTEWKGSLIWHLEL
jgi:hypothetical protein